MINQLDIPDAGDVYVQGVKLAAADIIQVRRQIGFVMQKRRPLPHRTVAQNIATVPRLLGWSKKHIRARIDELVDLMSLDRNVLPAIRTSFPVASRGAWRSPERWPPIRLFS